MRRDTLLIALSVVMLVGWLWLAVTHPNRALKDCQFLWFGESGSWDCPKGSTNG